MNSTHPLLMEIDCGNSAAKWRMLSVDKVVKRGVVEYADGFTQLFQDLDSWGENLVGCRVVSVAPEEIETELQEAWAAWASSPIRFAKVERQCAGVQCGYDDLSQMGVDRWAAIVAASQIAEGACVVIDAGTAITADILDAQRCHLGGYILPGIDIMLVSLSQNTAIPEERMPCAEDLGSIAPGKLTSSAIANAVSLAIRGFVDRVVAEVEESVSVIYTGGQAKLLGNILSYEAKVKPDLVLDGLALLLPLEIQNA